MSKLKMSFLFGLVIIAVGVIFGFSFASGFYQEDSVFDTQISQNLRIQVIEQLVAKGFDRFVSMPFGPGNDAMHLTGSQEYPNYPEYFFTTGIVLQDDLDLLLEKKIQEQTFDYSLYNGLHHSLPTALTLSDEEIASLQKVYFFKNQQDLIDLGYVVSSYRTRVNTDDQGRKDNIMISYWNMGNVRVLNPNQEVSFMDEIHYDPDAPSYKKDLAYGRANMGGIKRVRGGGICGAAWGINAVLLPNRAIEITKRYNHTRTYKNLYKNVINGEESWVPGLDIAVYFLPGSTKDYWFKNVRTYPVVLVMNYDGTPGGTEELFVLSKIEDRGYVKYTGKDGNCYFWEANEKPFKSCYGSVLR